MELGIDEACQHVVCLLHHIELYFRHQFETVDGVSLGPDKLEGPIGGSLNKEIWREPIVNFKKIFGKMPILPDSVLAELSTDQ